MDNNIIICNSKEDIDKIDSEYWGSEFYTITKEDIEALMAGKTLAFIVNDEYSGFVKMKEEKQND